MTLTAGGLDIQTATLGSGLVYAGGGHHDSYHNIILRGNTSTGVSGIGFTSSKGTTSINVPSDCAFIQFHPYNPTLAAIGTNPTLGTSGESNKLIIGVNNDADDMIYLQTPNVDGLKHVVGTSVYPILDSNNYSSYAAAASHTHSYLPLSGGSLTGLLYFNQLGNGNDTYIGHANTSWMHFQSPVPFYFSTNVSVNGDITQYSTGYTWIHSGNISSQSVNYATSAGSASSSSESTLAYTVYGRYTSNGGQQGPGYFGKNRVGFLMSNATVNGNSNYKNWIYMDNYHGNDVGGCTALGLDRMGTRAFIMQSDYNRSSWNNSAEIITTANIGSQSVNYATSAGSVAWGNVSGRPTAVSSFTNDSGYITSSGSCTSASYLPTCYVGGDKPNPQQYFSNSIGCRVAMTRCADIGMGSAWHDTLWVNGYSGGDVPYMCSLHFKRSGEPRFAISTQTHTSTGYGSIYEVITKYNIGSQSVNYATSAGNADTVDGYHYNGLPYIQRHNWWNYGDSHNADDLSSGTTFAYSNHSNCPTTGTIVSFNCNNSTGYPLQLQGTYYAENLYFRNRNGDNGSWQTWRYVIHSGGDQTKSGNLTCANFYANSDRHIKSHIRTIDRLSLERLFKVSDKLLKKYTLKQTGKESYGFVAQELEKYIPEAVTKNNDDIKSVSYNIAYAKLFASLVNEIKKLKAQVKTLMDDK